MSSSKKRLALVSAGVVVICVLLAAVFVTQAGHEPGMEKHKKYTLYIGLNDGDTGMQKMATTQAKEILNDIAGKYIDGYTVYEADGYWKEDNMTFSEHTLVCVIVDAPEQSVRNIMDELLKGLNQHSILLEAGESYSIYYSGK